MSNLSYVVERTSFDLHAALCFDCFAMVGSKLGQENKVRTTYILISRYSLSKQMSSLKSLSLYLESIGFKKIIRGNKILGLAKIKSLKLVTMGTAYGLNFK